MNLTLVGGILLIINAGVLAWILIETRRERLDETLKKLSLIVSTNIVNLAYATAEAHDGNQDVFNATYSKALQAHADYTNRNGVDVCVQIAFSELIRTLAFEAYLKPPANRQLFVDYGLDYLAKNATEECKG